MTESGQILLSYGRADDEPFVERLRDALVARGVAVWWDRRSMESRGRTFLQEIRDAIEHCERVLPVIGPAALASRVVRYEWDHAHLYSRAVMPLLRAGAHTDVPPEFALFHTVDCRKERDEAAAIDEICRLLATPVPPLAVLHRVPLLPPNFLARKERLAAIRDSVLADVRTATAIDARRAITVLRGMGGAGKSVLAASFARSRELRMAAADGVLWLGAGREADVESLLQRALALLGVGSLPAAGVADLTEALARRLEHDAILLILDDAWALEAIEPLRRALGVRTRLLVTTRDASLSASLGATEIAVDALEEPQAVELLAMCMGQPVDELPAEAAGLVSETGRLPLALAMIGALLRQSPGRAASYLDRLRQARVDKIEAPLPDYPYPNLARVIAVSLEALPAVAQGRFLDLGVLPDPPRAPGAAIEAWWIAEGMDRIAAEDTLDLLTTRSLVRRDLAGVVSLHDLAIDYARRAHLDLPGAHRRLVASYEGRCRDGFASGPDDGYFFQSLGHHLEQSGRGEELLPLVLDSPAWLAAKFRAVRPDATGLDDIGRAAKYAAARPESEAALAMVARVFRSEGALWSNDDLETLVLLGRVDEAIQAASLRSQNPYPGYSRLARALAGRDREAAATMLDRAEQAARVAAASASRRAAELAEVSRHWRELGDEARAEGVLDEARQSGLAAELEDRDEALWPVASLVAELVRCGRDADARRLATALADPHVALWANLAAALARRGDEASAEEILGDQLAGQPPAIRVAHLARLADSAARGATRTRWLEAGLSGWRALTDWDERFQGAQLLLPPAHLDDHPAADELRQAIRDYPLSRGGWSQLSGPSAAQGLALFGGLVQAQELAAALGSVSARSEAQFRVVQALITAARIDDALALSSQIEALGERGDAASLVACALAARRDPRAVEWLEHARTLRLEGHQRISMFEAASLVADALREPDAPLSRRMLAWMGSRVRLLAPDFDLSSSLAAYARACFREGLPAEGREALERITNDVVTQDLLNDLAQDLARAGQRERAHALVEEIEPGWRREAARAEVWINAGRHEEALQAIAEVTRDYNRTALLARAAALVHEGDPGRAASILEEAEQRARTAEDDWFPDQLGQDALAEVVRAHLACGQPEAAWRIIESMPASRAKFGAALGYAETLFSHDEGAAAALLTALHRAAVTAGGEDGQFLLEELAEVLVRLDLRADARSVLERLSAADRGAERRSRLARLYAGIGAFPEACRELLAESIDLFAGAVASWAPHYERVEPGLARRVLAEVTRVAGWVRADWREVHELIAREASAESE